MLVIAAHDVEQARRIVADFGTQRPQGHELPGARGHLGLLAAPEQGDELHEPHLEAFRRPPERDQARAQPRDVAVMIGAPDVEQMLEAPLALVQHEGDVGGEIGLDAVLAHHHPILFVAIIRALEPERSFLEVGVAALLHFRDRPVDGAIVDQRALAEPGIENHAELRKILADVAQDCGQGVIEHAAERRVAEQPARADDDGVDVRFFVPALRLVGRKSLEDLRGFSDECRSLGRVQLCRDGEQIVPAVAVGRKVEALAALLEVSEPCARRENFHLASGVVHVVLARHAIAHGLEQIRDGGAVRGAATMPDMQGTRRIGRHEFHERRLAPARRGAAVRIAQRENPSDLGAVGIVMEEEV